MSVMNVAEKIAEVKGFLEEVAFLVSSGTDLPNAHRKIVKALVSLEEIERMLSQQPSSSDNDLSEVSKVTRRLKLWAKRPEQINSRILSAYLILSANSEDPVTENELRDAVGESNFDLNFVQMKNIAEKNHGKVFDVIANKVSIWPPVVSAVEEFRKATSLT